MATLGYSRASYVRFTAGEDAATLCECLREAFVYFGGTPEQVLFDNAKSVIVERDAFSDGQHRWNAQLLALAETYGFTPKVCRPYRAKTKGKVERFNRYLKEGFVVPLAATLNQSGLKLDVEAANARIGRWLAEVANVRVHASTRERPAARLSVEQAALLPLPRSVTPAPLAWPLHRVRACNTRWRYMTRCWESPHESPARTDCHAMRAVECGATIWMRNARQTR